MSLSIGLFAIQAWWPCDFASCGCDYWARTSVTAAGFGVSACHVTHGIFLIGDGVALDQGVILLATGPRKPHPRIVIGGGTYCNRFTMFDASERIEVGRDCMIGPHCYITDHDHLHGRDKLVRAQQLISAPARLEAMFGLAQAPLF
jgi:hypothetical protein